MSRNEPPGTQLGENLRRMFLERGLDFFNQDEEQRRVDEPLNEHGAGLQSRDTESLDDQRAEAMSPEALSNMRNEILPQLQYASLTPQNPQATAQGSPVSHLVRCHLQKMSFPFMPQPPLSLLLCGSTRRLFPPFHMTRLPLLR